MPKLSSSLPMPILALDMATKTGWAHSDGAGGLAVLPSKPKGEASNGERFNWFMSWVEQIVLEHPTSLVVYESGSHKRGGAAMRIGIGMVAALEIICFNLNVPLTPLNTKRVKKHATGNGNANKEMMIEAAKKRWSLKHFDDNYVDARWLLDYATTLGAKVHE